MQVVRIHKSGTALFISGSGIIKILRLHNIPRSELLKMFGDTSSAIVSAIRAELRTCGYRRFQKSEHAIKAQQVYQENRGRHSVDQLRGHYRRSHIS